MRMCLSEPVEEDSQSVGPTVNATGREERNCWATMTGQKANRNVQFPPFPAYHCLSTTPYWHKGNAVCRAPITASQSRVQKAGVETEKMA